MTYDDLTVLIPSHSLEDFPTDLGEKPAEGLLNAFAILWHPVLLATANVFPRWQRADEVHDVRANRLIVLPTTCTDSVPHGWVDRARREGSTVVSGLTDRREMLTAALQPLGDIPAVEADLEADFLAFGSCYLQMELLTRHMRNFSRIDEVHLHRESVAAAKAALQGDRVAAETHLRYCFEMLLEARERFYPVNCFLIDLCLVIPRLADEHLSRLLAQPTPCNLLATAEDWRSIAAEHPDLVASVSSGWKEGRIEVIGGEYREAGTPLLALNSLLWQFRKGLATYRELFNRHPVTWGRRRFGIDPYLPQIVNRHGMSGGLHLVLDDGIYPDEEHSKLRWEGCDGSVINALSRIPLAADSASAFLRFAIRMSESMDHDHSAAVVFARWPELKTPWLDDFRRASRYAAVLGKFTTFRAFFDANDMPGRLAEHKAADYFSPNLVQAVARQETDPLSRHVDYWRRRGRFESLEWCRNLAEVLRQTAVPREAHDRHEDLIESADPDAAAEAKQAAETALDDLKSAAPAALSQLLARDAARGAGLLVINPLSFPRRTVVDWPADLSFPAGEEPIAARQFDDAHRQVLVDVPACGFAWVPAPSVSAEPPRVDKVAAAEDLLLRNDLFEVNLSDVTGGIGQVRTYRRSPNRVSQQIAFRFPRERTITLGEGDEAEQYKTFYSEMRLRDSRVLCAGPALGEIETVGDVVDQQNEQVLAAYRQVTRVWRGRPFVEFDIDLDVKKVPDGDPWTNYIGVRFAWKHTSAVLTRSLHHGAHGIRDERIEAPQYLELADDDFRTTIIPFGLPFHRQTGDRMLDTLLVTAGETRRQFRFAVAIDEPYPLQAALDATYPVIAVPAKSGPAHGARSGWLFHLSAANVQLMRILPLLPSAKETEAAPTQGFALRLLETEGRRKTIKLHCFRAPASARQRDFQGETIQTLRIDGDAVQVEVAPYEVCDVELRYGP
jgi:alpha-mannosidase